MLGNVSPIANRATIDFQKRVGELWIMDYKAVKKINK